MHMDDLVRLLEYRAWARERVLTAVESLPAEKFTAPVVSSFPSLRDTLVHTLSADRVWTLRLGGDSTRQHMDPTEFADVAALRARWEQVDRDLRAAVTASEPDRVVTYRNFAGEEFRQPVAQIIQHLVNHQTYHFGQVATLLRQLGAAPAAGIDLCVFDRR